MSSERWREIEGLFERAGSLGPDARASFLKEACGDDLPLWEEVRSLLQADSEAGDFLDETSVERLSSSVCGRRLGEYRILSTLGRGGMGSVFLAEAGQEAAVRLVAIKVLRLDADCRELRQRFRIEARILAEMDHPHLARLLDSGQSDDGTPYLVMEFVDGQRIDTYCSQRNLSLEGRLALFCQVCRAVHFAHRRGIVHRDLKPGNILVTSDGVPKLLDFGIAKLLIPEQRLHGGSETGTWPALFTPAYASPEQLRGEEVSPASDVYSLGVLLGKILTGLPASARLRAIVAQALRRRPRDRFSSAAALAEDLERYLGGRPVRAYEAQRRRRLKGALWSSVAVLAFGLGALGLRLSAAGPGAGMGGAQRISQSEAPVDWCVPDGGLDDTLRRTDCCSGVAVGGSTVCLDAADWNGSWSSCSQICGSQLNGGCVETGGVDDTLHRTRCCSGRAVPGSTRCLDPTDFGTTWRTCIQTCA
ncbi:MAG: serine/threonine protein kinase [Acidobacteria bacterium]|nr:serine/threonine protein kinase [Acidobacteriota bacterium]